MYRRKLENLGNPEDGDLRVFYKFSYYKKDKKITKDEYFNYIRRRLKRSVYPRQINDFFFMKKDKKDKKDKEIPIDWLLAPIVKYFWNNDIETWNLDQGGRDYEDKENIHPAFIRIVYSKKALEIVKKMKVNYKRETYKRDKFIFITFNQDEIPKIYERLNLEKPDINKAFKGNLLWQDFSDNKKDFKFVNLENEFSEMVEYPDFFDYN